MLPLKYKTVHVKEVCLRTYLSSLLYDVITDGGRLVSSPHDGEKSIDDLSLMS